VRTRARHLRVHAREKDPGGGGDRFSSLRTEFEDPLGYEFTLASQRGLPGVELVTLNSEDIGELWIGGPAQKIFREGQRLHSITLSDQTSFAYAQSVRFVVDHGDLCLRPGCIKAQQDLAWLNQVALTDKNIAHDAGLKVLQDSSVQLNNESSIGDRSAVDLGHGPPTDNEHTSH
jgi:hypothetical protein